MTTNPARANRWDLGSSLVARTQRTFGLDPYDPNFGAAMTRLQEDDRRAYEASRRRWGIADKLAFGAAALPFAAAAAPALTSLFTGGSAAAPAASTASWSMPGVTAPTFGAGSTAGAVTSAATKAATAGGKLATLGKLFSSPGLELGVNAGLNLYSMKQGQKAADQARADQIAANKEAIALERQRLEAELRNADLDREDARALNAAINELKKRELDAAEEERAFNRGLVEAREARLAPYRGMSEAAMRKLSAMWGIG